MNSLGLCHSVPRPQRILTLAFLFPGKEDPLFNKMVAAVSWYGACHVELVFENNMAFSIFANSNLFFKARTFSNPDYHLISLSVSHAEYTAAYNFCLSCMTQDIQFTDLGMFAAYFQPQTCPFLNTPPSSEVGYTFCSKIVTEALQFAALPEVDSLVPCTTTPSVLFGAVKESTRKVLNSVPSKRERLKSEGVIRI
jgi:hypothetical protein